MIRKVLGLHYSPVGGTAKMTRLLTGEIARRLNECSPEDITVESCALREGETLPEIDDETVVILGMPAYIGKIPLPAIRALRMIEGSGAMALGLVSYGGRNYGNALYELIHFADEKGMTVIGAGAISIGYKVRRGSAETGTFNIDTETLNEFADAAASKIRRLGGCDIEGLRIKPAPLEVRGRMPVHRISRFYPQAAAMAQALLSRVLQRRVKSEWYL